MKKITWLWMAACVCLAVQARQAGTACAGEKIVLPIASVAAPGTPFPQGLQRMADILNATGNFDVTVFPGSQLGSIPDTMDRCLDGDALVINGDPTDFAAVTVEDMFITSAPFLFETWEQVTKLMTSDWWKEVSAKVEKKGLKILASNWSYGTRNFLTKKPITKLSDLAGMRMRTPNSMTFIKMYEALGASPTPMPMSENFTALQQGVIDGLDIPISFILSFRLNEIAKYIVEEDPIKQIGIIVCGTDFFNSLSPEMQEQLVRAAEEAGEYEFELIRREAEETRAKLKAEGVTFTHIDRDEFVKAAEKFYDYPEFSAWEPGLRERVMKIINEGNL